MPPSAVVLVAVPVADTAPSASVSRATAAGQTGWGWMKAVGMTAVLPPAGAVQDIVVLPPAGVV